MRVVAMLPPSFPHLRAKVAMLRALFSKIYDGLALLFECYKGDKTMKNSYQRLLAFLSVIFGSVTAASAQVTLQLGDDLSAAPDISALTTAALAFAGAFVSIALLIKGIKWLMSAIV